MDGEGFPKLPSVPFFWLVFVKLHLQRSNANTEHTVSYRCCKPAATLRIMQYAVSLCKLFPCPFPLFQDEICIQPYYTEISCTGMSNVLFMAYCCFAFFSFAFIRMWLHY